MKARLPHIFLAAAAALLMAGGKSPDFIISFHEEGAKEDGKTKVMEHEVLGEKRYFRIMPAVTQKDIKAYFPFKAEDGQTWGAAFWLDTSGQHALQRVGVGNRQQFLAAAVNRVPVDIQLIDNAPEDNIVVIWKGLDEKLFPLFDKKFKRLGAAGAGAGVAAAPAKEEKSGFSFFGKGKKKDAEFKPAADPTGDFPVGPVGPEPGVAKKPAPPAKTKGAFPKDVHTPLREDPSITRLPEPGQ